MSKFNINISERNDAGENAFFERALEHVRPTLVETLYGLTKANQFLPVNTSVDPGARVFTWQEGTKYGSADVTSDYATQAKRADVSVGENHSPIVSLRTAYGYSIQEARSAAMAARSNLAAGANLLQRKADAARDAMVRKLDDVALLGDGTMTYGNVRGLYKLANTNTSYTTATGAGGGTTFASKTPDEVLADLTGIWYGIVETSKENYEPTDLILPLSSYNYCAKVRMGDANNSTILKYFIELTGANVSKSSKLETAGSGNAKRMVCYRKDPQILEWVLPVPFEQFAPQMQNMEIVTDCHARTAGVIAYHPKAVAYCDSI